MKILVLFAFIFLLSPTAVYAGEDDVPVIDENFLADFCKDSPEPSTGKHSDGTPADPVVMALTAGTHKLPSGYEVTLFESNHYIVRFPNGVQSAGCSKEGISETIKSNSISLDGQGILYRS